MKQEVNIGRTLFAGIATASRCRHWLALLVLPLWLALPAQAHHSNVAFETDKIAEVNGTVSEWQWSNPHTWLRLMVSDGKGGAVEWAFEGRPPGMLSRVGWSPKIFKKGDVLTVHYSPAKDGTHTGLIARVTLADGTILQYAPASAQ